MAADESTLVIRPLRPDDADAVSALYGACMATEPGIGPVSAAAWSNTIRLPQFGGGRDFLVAVEGGERVGLAESSLRDGGAGLSRMVKILVHPGRRRHGIGTALLRAVLEQGPIGTLSRWRASLGPIGQPGSLFWNTSVSSKPRPRSSCGAKRWHDRSLQPGS